MSIYIHLSVGGGNLVNLIGGEVVGRRVGEVIKCVAVVGENCSQV